MHIEVDDLAQFLISDSMARKKNASRKLREILPVVIGAGITEQWYFRHLKQMHGCRIDVRPRFFGSDTAYDMEKLVEEVLSIGGKVICVYDMDTTRTDAVEKERKEKFVAAYRANPNVILCGSLPSIEYWFLLHFEKVNHYFASSEKVIEELKKYMLFEKTEKFLSKPGWVETLLADGRLQQAMRNADELGTEGESYTHIPDAIRFLEKHKKK